MDTIDAREAHWTALTATVASLEARVEALEQTRRTDRIRSYFGLMIGVVLSFVVALSVGAHAQISPQTLVCKELKVVGDDGKTRIDLYSSPKSNGDISTFNSDGKELVHIGGSFNQSGASIGGFLTINSNDDKSRVQLGNNIDNAGYVLTCNSAGTVLTAIGDTNDARHDGYIGTRSAATGKELAVLLTAPDTGDGRCAVFDKDGNFKKSFP